MSKHLSVFKFPAALAALVAALLPGVLHAADRTWTDGFGNENWAKSTNWSPATVPATGDNLIFSGTVGLNNSNNISAGLSLNSIIFTGSAGAFTLNGLAINLSGTTVAGATITNNSTNTQTFSFSGTGISIGASGLTVQANSGQIDFQTKINLQDSFVVVTGPNTVTFDQKISGAGQGASGGLNVGTIGGVAGNVVINANNNTWTGSPQGIGAILYSGTLIVNNGNALGSGTFVIDRSGTAAGVTFGSGSDSVNVSTNVDVKTSFNIAPAISGSTGMVMSGTVTLDSSTGAVTITALNSNQVRFSNTIQENGGPEALTLDGGGVGGSFVFGGSNANTYTGTTTVTNGASLVLNHIADNTAIAGDLQIDAGSIVRLQAAGQIADTSNVLANGTFDINGNNETVASLSGTGLVRLDAAVLTVGSGTFSGDIRDNGAGGSLVMNGTSTLLLDSANHYAGGTTLNSGTLLANHANALGSGTLVINGGASTFGSLAGDIHIDNAVDALTGFQVAPSGAVGSGTLTMSGLVTLDTSGGTTDFRLTATNGNVFRLVGGIAQSGTGIASLTYDGGGAGVLGIFRIGDSTATYVYGGLTTVTDNATLILNNGGTNAAVPGDLQIDADSTVRFVSNPEQIADTATVTDNGTLDLNDRSETIATLLGSGTLNVGSGTFTVGSGTFSGGFTGSNSTIIKSGAGTLVLTGVSLVTGITNINGGELVLDGTIGTTVLANAGTFSGTGFVAGPLVNAALVAPGHPGTPGTITVKEYKQTSAGTLTLRVGGTAPGQSDKLVDEGSAALAGTLQLVRLNNFHGKLGDKIALVTTGGLGGTFTSVINPFGTNTMVKADIIYDANNVYLSFDQGSFLQFAQMNGLSPNELAVAAALDSVAANQRLAVLIGFLNGEPLQNLPGDFKLISPDKLTAVFDISRSHAEVQGANIENRLAQDRAETGDDGVTVGLLVGDGKSSVDKNVTTVDAGRKNRWGFFMEGSGEFVRANGDSNSAGYNFTTAGVTVGGDYRVNDHLVAGVLAGYANTGSTQLNNGPVDVNGGRLGLFGMLYGHGLYLNAMAAGGYNSYETHRLGLGGIAQGKTQGEEFDGLLSTGYEVHEGALTVGPVASLQYTYVGIDGFNETGSLAPLNILSQSQDSLRSNVGFRMAYNWKLNGVTVTPGFTAGWQHEFLSSAFALDSQFASGAGNVFTVHGPAFGRDGVVVNAGVSVQWNTCLGTYLYYNGELGRKNYQLNSVTGGMKLSF